MTTCQTRRLLREETMTSFDNEPLTLLQLDGVSGGGKKVDVVGAVKFVAGLIGTELKMIGSVAGTILQAGAASGSNPHQL